MSKEKPRTPLITVEVPHPEENVRMNIGAELVETWFNESLEFDTTAAEITIISRDPNSGRILLKESYTATNWEEIQEFLDDIRHRFAESLFDELLEYVKMHLEAERIEEWPTRIDRETIIPDEIPGVLSKEDVVVTWLRNTLGLEGRARPIISVSNISRSRLTRGTDPARAVLVREARALMKMWRSED